MTIAVYPGSFDPITNGHLDIVTRAARLFDTVIMAVFDRPNKNLLFSTDERISMVKEATRHLPRVKVDTYSALTVAYVREIGASVIVRGLRDPRDFDHEFQMAQINNTLAPEIDVVLFMAAHQYTFFSSSTVREIASLGGDVSWLVPGHVVSALKRAYQDKVM
ncbi:MAG: pantetheine-phosphate adenylyltransferase [Chloroflexi bacterium SZAS-1]|nr:pantetheine-phosphate adenylyltransferase [Chloroflexi bacterium SZAS-1]HNP86355.1 pantetheine-phosphate adenylyltransferase [Kouleothrix sp.]